MNRLWGFTKLVHVCNIGDVVTYTVNNEVRKGKVIERGGNYLEDAWFRSDDMHIEEGEYAYQDQIVGLIWKGK